VDRETRKDLGYILAAVALALLGLVVSPFASVLGVGLLLVAGFTIVVCLINLALTLIVGPQRR